MSRRSKDHRSSPQAGAGPSQRQLRAAELVRHALVEILAREEFMDPALKGVSITLGEVRASPDLKHMHAFVAPLGQGDPAAIAEALNRARGFLRGLLGRRIDTKFTPELHFLPDTSYDEATRINMLLRQPVVQRDLDSDDESET
jgi:ribosome-binding factor A